MRTDPHIVGLDYQAIIAAAYRPSWNFLPGVRCETCSAHSLCAVYHPVVRPCGKAVQA